MSGGLVDRHVGFLDALRAAGLPVSLAEGVDAVAALSALRWDDRETVRTAYAATLVKRSTHRPTFDALFELYFPPLVGAGAGARADADEDEPATSLVLTLQGRGLGTEVFCTVESIESRPAPPTGAVVDLLELALHRRRDPSW